MPFCAAPFSVKSSNSIYLVLDVVVNVEEGRGPGDHGEAVLRLLVLALHAHTRDVVDVDGPVPRVVHVSPAQTRPVGGRGVTEESLQICGD